MNKQPEATERTRKNLVEAFWNLYSEKKIDHITIKEITDSAGYHRSTFYEYFIDIYDVLNQVEENLLTYIEMHVIDRLKFVQDLDFTRNLANLYDEKGRYLSVLLGENGDPNFIRKVKALMLPALSALYGLSENEIHTAYIIDFASSGILSAVTHWYQTGKNLPPEELVELIRSMLLRGVLPIMQKYSEAS